MRVRGVCSGVLPDIGWFVETGGVVAAEAMMVQKDTGDWPWERSRMNKDGDSAFVFEKTLTGCQRISYDSILLVRWRGSTGLGSHDPVYMATLPEEKQ